MHETILKILEVFEMLIPIIFLVFTHAIDTKVHKQNSIIHSHPNKWIKILYRYQWELSFLIISLLFVLGIQMFKIHHDLCSFIIALAAMGAILILLGTAFFYVTNNEPKVNAIPLYLSYVCYATYVLFYFYHSYTSDHNPSWLLLITITILLIGLILFYRWIENLLFIVILKPDDPLWNSKVYHRRKTPSAKKMEAIGLIVEYYEKVENRDQLNNWIDVCKTDFPNEISSIIPSRLIETKQQH